MSMLYRIELNGKALLGNFHWPGASGLLLPSSSDVQYFPLSTTDTQFLVQAVQQSLFLFSLQGFHGDLACNYLF